MIEISGQEYAFSDPLIIFGFVSIAVVVFIVVMLMVVVRSAGRSVAAAEPLAQQMDILGQHVQQLSMGQAALQGGLQTVSDTQVNAQAQITNTMEVRLAAVQQQMQDRLAENAMRAQHAMAEMQERMKETLSGSSKQTTVSLTQLQERLVSIDKAQDNIAKLSGDVLSLQDILSNKQTRGAFGGQLSIASNPQ